MVHQERETPVSEQNSAPVSTVRHPTIDDPVLMNMYWEQQGQPWRTEPEIDAERQKYLQERRHRVIKDNKFFSPLKGNALSRADIEWLLATHENGRGPLDWSDPEQRKRKGLHLYGVDLRGVNLSRLPLANADLSNANLEQAQLSDAHLEDANLVYAHLDDANLSGAYLQDAFLYKAHLEGANLVNAHLEGTILLDTYLEGADLSRCYLDAETDLRGVTIFSREMGAILLSDVHWGDANLAVVDWSTLSILGYEPLVLQFKNDGTPESKAKQLEFLRRTTRAYRQLSVVLRNQGLTEDAARFAYRAQLMQRKLFWHQRRFGQYLFSLLVNLTTGYGYKAKRSFITYAVTISLFALIYFLLGPHLAWNEAVVISMTAFHGRGFFPDQFKPGDPQALVASIEAFVGLLIEVTFIATLTQRLFGK